MSKQKVIKSKFIPGRLPVLGTIVAWLFYRELHLVGAGAGVNIPIYFLAQIRETG